MLHALAAQTAEALDGVLHALFHKAVAAVELLALAVHLMSEEACLHCHGDFCRAGGLGTVAHDAAGDGQGVDDGVGDLLHAAAMEEGDTRTGRRAGADGAAVGGKSSNAGLGVGGEEVGDQKGAVHGVFLHAHVLCILNHRQGSGHALVAAARVDDDRQLTAAHAGVGTGGGPGLGPGADVGAYVMEEGLADVGAPVAPQALVGDGGVHLHLAMEGLTDILQVTGGGKVIDTLHAQKRVIRCLGVHHLGLHGFFPEDPAVLFNQDDVGVLRGDADLGIGVSLMGDDADIQHHAPVHRDQGDGGGCNVRGELCFGLLGNCLDDLQKGLFIAAQNADGCGGCDAPATIGAGNNNALYVFDDIAAGLHLDAVRDGPQNRPGHGGTVGDGNGLCAALGAH